MTGINEVAKEIHENARAHGWWDEERGFPAAISQKHEYNKSRPYRHGGKKC